MHAPPECHFYKWRRAGRLSPPTSTSKRRVTRLQHDLFVRRESPSRIAKVPKIGDLHGTKPIAAASIATGREDLSTEDNATLRQCKCRFARRVYGGHYSDDGNTFCVAVQDGRILLFNSSRGTWELANQFECLDLQWTITDSALSPGDGSRIAYSSISPIVSVANTRGDLVYNEPHPITEDERIGVWSLAFAGAGAYLVAGCSRGLLAVEDLHTKTIIGRAIAHEADINSVCTDQMNPHQILTGSDDNLIKVWDTRMNLSESNCAGTLVGHSEGITCVRTRPTDHWTVASNSKDQKLKLWDLRKLTPSYRLEERQGPQSLYWDYRFERYPSHVRRREKESGVDDSIATVAGHSVHSTLIRCAWSPSETTGGRYIASGSACGRVFIWDTRGNACDPVAILRHSASRTPVRDISWSPKGTSLCSSGWNGQVLQWGLPHVFGSSPTDPESTDTEEYVGGMSVVDNEEEDDVCSENSSDDTDETASGGGSSDVGSLGRYVDERTLWERSQAVLFQRTPPKLVHRAFHLLEKRQRFDYDEAVISTQRRRLHLVAALRSLRTIDGVDGISQLAKLGDRHGAAILADRMFWSEAETITLSYPLRRFRAPAYAPTDVDEAADWMEYEESDSAGQDGCDVAFWSARRMPPN